MQRFQQLNFVLILAGVLWILSALPINMMKHLPVFAGDPLIYVSASEGMDEPGCGLSSDAGACRTVKYAVEQHATTGAQILVAAGIYTEPVSVITPGIKIFGAGHLSTTLDGENVRGPMITFGPAITNTTVFSGFTVQNGITATAPHGGGIYIDGASPEIRQVQIVGNTGDGVYLAPGSAPLLRGNTLCANTQFDLNSANDGDAPDFAGNWWGINSPAAGSTYTGTLIATPAISAGIILSQPGMTDTLLVDVPATITVTLRGGGESPPPGTSLTLKAVGGSLSGGTTVELLPVDGVATTVFTPTGTKSAAVFVYHACNPALAVARLDYRHQTYLPLVLKGYPPAPPEPACPATSSNNYSLIPVDGPPADHPDDLHGDLNLSLRGWEEVTGVPLNLVSYSGGTDSDAPKMQGLFTDSRVPGFSAAYQVHAWDWGCEEHGCRGDLLSTWPTTLLGMETTPGETIRIPSRNANIYSTGGQFKAMVLYAEERRITLAYSRRDQEPTAGSRYLVHIEDVCVDPKLLVLYELQVGEDGMRISDKLPALENGQPLGTALNGEIKVAIRDGFGDFLDPRSQKDWW